MLVSDFYVGVNNYRKLAVILILGINFLFEIRFLFQNSSVTSCFRLSI